MICSACSHDNRPGAKFCEECATPLARACASCGAELRPTAKFCDECGAPTGASPRPATPPRASTDAADSRKVVTIVFADLVGSTALHERLEPESARRFMESYYVAMRGAVESQGGTVTQLLGDGVKAVFGIPRVAEDDAIRAVRAAAAMQDAFRALADAQRGAVGKTGLRVAVNTGEVVANDATEIIGDPVNVAARLQEQGHDGDVVVGESTHRLVSTLVTLELLGSFALKGRSETVKAYRVISLDRPAGAATAPFVGRDEELARLSAVYETAVEKPAAALAVLVGSPGLGKSRLIDEFARRHADAATVVRAHCDAAAGATFAPLAVALRGLLGIEDGANADALRAAIEGALSGEDADRARIASGVAALLAGSPASPEETFFVVRRMLGALAQRKPVVLVIDDLHWAEPLLLDLVEHLIQWGSGVPLFVLIGARPELRDLRSSLVTPGGLVADVVTLSGLDAGAAMRLAANVIGASDLPAAIAAKVLATSEGNPLFVGELVRMLVQEGALTREGERWVVGANLAALEMPPTIHALLAARIERLRPEERAVLERAAVVGRHFSRSAVAALLPREAGDLDARLEALRRSELIERDTGWLLGEPVLRFHHVLIRDAAYRRLLKGTRAELHAKLADWIETQVGGAAEHDETIGWHLEQAHAFLRELGPLDESGKRLGERAAQRLAAAGRRALARDDLPVAADLLGRAIERLDAGDPARADLALDWCEALLAAGDVAPASAAISELGRFSADSDRLRAWHTCFTGQHTVLTAPSALNATAETVAAAAGELTSLGDAAGEAKAHFVHALALSRLGKVGACEAALDRALAAARRAGDRRRANTVLAIAPLAALWGPSPVTRASGRCLDVVRVLRITQGAPAVEAVALSCQGVLEALRGRGDAARRMIASARKMVEELGITQRLLEADVFGGLVELLEGEALGAERSLRGAYDGLRDLGLGIDAARAAALLARSLLAQDRVAEAETLSHESEALAGDDLKAAIAWRGVRAEALARRGEHAAAVEFASKAVELAAATDALLDHADARLALAAALRAAGRGREAAAEERRAKELWQAKGATLLADRTVHAPASVAAPVAVTAPRTATPRRRPVRPNFAFEEMRRAEAAVAARDARALEALYRPDIEIVDHQFGITYGHAEIFERVRAIIEDSTESAFAHEPLASLGDSLALCRMRSTASGSTAHGISIGATEVPYLLVIEADEQGSARLIEIFGDDKLGEAVVRLYERYAEGLPEGPERARAAMAARSVAAVQWTRGEPDERLTGVLARDFIGVDHRHLSNWSLHGAAAYIDHLSALRQVADDIEFREVDVVALAPNAQLLRVLHTGTDRAGGGVYERPFLSLFVNDAEGKLARGEWFDDAREAEALARFDALAGEAAPTAPVRRRVPANAATAVDDRFVAAVAARDLEAARACFDPNFAEIDHSIGSQHGHDTAMAGLEFVFRSPDLVLENERLATLGSSLLLARRSYRGSSFSNAQFETGDWRHVQIALEEAGDQDRFVRAEVFAPDRLGEAVARLYERYAELLPDGPERARAAMAARSVAAVTWSSDPEPRLAAVLATDFVGIDHRHLSNWSLRGAAMYIEHLRALQQVADDIEFRQLDVVALGPNAQLMRVLHTGTDRASGGIYERPFLSLFATDADGRLARGEWFDADREAEALARFDALVAGDEPKQRALRRVQANAATRAFERFGATLAARDRDALGQHFDESLEVVHHPTRANYSRREMITTWRSTLKAERFEFRQEILASLGDALALDHHLVSVEGLREAHLAAVGAAEFDEISLLEVDASGRWLRSEIFAADRLGDAIVRLYERHAGRLPEGAARARAEATARSVAVVAPGGFDRDRYAAVFRPDVEIVDHRLVGLGSYVGSDALFRSMAAGTEVGDQVVSRPQDVLTLTHDALLLRWLASGIGRVSGGAFEWAFLRLLVFDADGRVARYELFDDDREAEALARFDALTTAPEKSRRLARPVRPNRATAAIARFDAACVARDLDAAVAQHRADLDETDHPTGSRYDLDGARDGLRRLLRAQDPHMTHEPHATLGESLLLARRSTGASATAGGRFDVGAWARDEWIVAEVDENELLVATEIFAHDRLGDAIVRLYERHAAQQPEGPARTRAMGVAHAVAIVPGPIDLDRMASGFAPDLRCADHRVFTTWASESGAELLDHFRLQLDLAPDFAARVDEVLALEPQELVVRITFVGTSRDSGGGFENRLCVHYRFGDDGRMSQVECFEAEHAVEALACFEALAGDGEAVSREHPFANAASRADCELHDCFRVRDWAGIEALAAPELVFDERRRMVRNRCGRDVWLEQLRILFDVPASRFTSKLIATRGERLSLHCTRLTGEVAGGGPLAIDDHLALHEVDRDGHIVAIVLFDLDDWDAYHELDARFAAGEASTNPRVAPKLGDSRLLSERDWRAYAADFAPGFVLRDHRVLGFGTLDAESFIRMQESLRDLSPDARERREHVRISEWGALIALTRVGTREEGVFEIPMITVHEMDEQGRRKSIDLYSIEDRDRALARFAELAAPGPTESPFANAASRLVARGMHELWAARDWDGIVAMFSPAIRMDDRRRIVRLEIGYDEFVAQFRMLFDQPGSRWREQLVATRGERLALTRTSFEAEVADGGGPLAFDEHWSLSEMDAAGRLAAFVTFDLEDEDAAYAELDARFESDPGAAHGRLAGEFVRAVARRDWDAVAALCSPVFVEHDHRSLAVLGTTRGAEAWMRNFRALVELAPDTHYRSLHVRTAARGFLSVGTWHGSREGGRYEIPLVAVLEVDTRGAIARADLYEPDQRDQALARFEALARRAPAAFENAASTIMEPLIAAVVANDWARYEALYTETACCFDRRRMVQLDFDRDAQVAFARELADGRRTRGTSTTLATRGERFALVRGTFVFEDTDVGPSEVDSLLVMEVDASGRIAAYVRFDPEDLDAAYAELDARFAAGEGATHPLAAKWLAGYLRHFAARDWDAMRALFAPDLVGHNHRLVGWGTLQGPAALVSTLEAQVALAPDTRERVDHVRTCARGVLFEYAWYGTHEGGAFENVWLVLVELDHAGRARRADVWEAEQQADALARFDALQAAPGSASPFANAATRGAEEVVAVWMAADWERFASLFPADFGLSDRRRAVQLELGRDDMIAFSRALGEHATTRIIHVETLATRGEQLALQHWSVELDGDGAGPSEISHLTLMERDERGIRKGAVRWDEDDLDAAYAELDARFEAGEGAAYPHALGSLVASNAAIRNRDWDALAARCAPTFCMRDHRLLGWGTTVNDAATFVRVIRSAAELAPDASYRDDHVRICARGILSRMALCGTREGGAFENPFLRVTEVDEQGRILCHDTYDESDLERALARFAELAAPAAPEGRFENAASRAWRTVNEAWTARDLQRFAAPHAAALRYRDHRRLFELDLDRAGFLDFTRPLLTMRAGDASLDLVATRGERLALMHSVMEMQDESVGPSVIESLMLIEADERGDIAAYDRWDLEDEDAAWAEIEARWDSGEGAQHLGLRAMREFGAALERRDWEAAAASYAPAFVGHDHRLVGFGTVHGPSALVRTLQEMVALAPDVRMRLNHRRACTRGAINDIAWLGTRDGGAFESPFVSVSEFGADGRTVRIDFYDSHHLDRALARFEEIRANERRDPLAAGVKCNLATASIQRSWVAFDQLDLDTANEALDAARATFAPDFVWEDRRPVVGLSGGLDLMIASARERLASGARHERRTIVGTAGDRVAIARVLWAGGPSEGRFEVEFLVVHEVDEAGLCTALIFFEPDDARAAQREAWSRWAAIDPAVAPWVELLNEINDAWNGRDRATLGARFAADVVVEDHRHAGIGRIEGSAAYVDANAVLWDLAPDQRIEFDSSFLAFDRHGLVATLRRVGTLADGGAFESEYVWLSLARDGRITHLELFEVEQQVVALARFEELRPDPLRVPPNAATRAVGRIAPLYSDADLPALRAIVSDDFVFDDRTRGSLLRGGVEEWVSGLRFLRTETRARLDSRLIATAGDRLALIQLSWQETPGESSFLIERFGVYEIDATGKLRAFVLFDAGDRAAALDELFERYAASGSDGIPDAAVEFARAVNAHDLERVRAVLPRDFVFDDHRRTGLGRLEGPDAYLPSVSAYWELSPDLRLDTLYGVAVALHGRVGVGCTWGTNAEGGAFESLYVSLLHHPQGRLAGIELFEPEDLDAALARLEALRPDPLPMPPTAATRMRDRHRDAFVARDWDAVRALTSADFVFEDRGKRALVRGDVEAWIASMEFTSQPGFRVESTLIGALGDRIVLDQVRWFGKPDGDAFEFERVRLLEVGADDLLRAVLFFDPEDRSAASVEGLARFAAGEAAGSAGLAPLVPLYRALGDRSWEAARDCFAPDLVFVDHRPLGLGTLDREQWIASMQAGDELGDGVIVDVFRVLAWSERGHVVAVRRFGTIADGGGRFEVDAILTRLVVDGRIRRVEVFGEADAERAVARFAELCAEGSA